jgi:glutaredoxin
VRKGAKVKKVTIYSRSNCHLCEVALTTVMSFAPEFDFEIERILIDGSARLEEKYGEQVPVILIDGQVHDYFRVNPERFRKALLS